jgi:hypothetical protein
MRIRTAVVLFSLHAVGSIASFLWRYSLSSKHFDDKPLFPGSVELAEVVYSALWFPFAKPLMDALQPPGILGWTPILANSLAVTAVALTISNVLARKRRPQ